MPIQSNLTLDDVFAYIDDLVCDEIDAVVHSEMARHSAIRIAMQTIYNRLVSDYPELVTKTSTISYSLGTVEYNIPADMVYPVQLYFEESGTPPKRIVVPIVSQAEAYRLSDIAAYIRDDKIGVVSVGQQAGTLKLDYVYRLQLGVTGGKTTDVWVSMTDEWFPAIVSMAALHLMTHSRKYELGRIAAMQAMLKDQLESITSIMTKRVRSAVPYIT